MHLNSVVHVDQVRVHDPKGSQILCSREDKAKPAPGLLRNLVRVSEAYSWGGLRKQVHTQTHALCFSEIIV